VVLVAELARPAAAARAPKSARPTNSAAVAIWPRREVDPPQSALERRL